MTERTAGRRPLVKLALEGVGVIVMLASILLCLGLLLVVGLGTSGGYSEPSTAGGWLHEITEATNVIITAVMASSVGLVVAACIAIVATRKRWAVAAVGAIACGIIFAATALLSGIGGSIQLRDLSERAVASVGQVGVAPTPEPVESTPPPFTVDDARTAILSALEMTVAAAVGPVVDAGGAPIDPALVTPSAGACQESGSQLTVTLELRTGENARSLTQILEAWDEAGYVPDRAMQTDIRYSYSLPIESMSIRDATTIDGLLHVEISARCTAVG